MALSTTNAPLADQKAALKAKLAKIEKQEKAENEKRMIVVGRAVLDEADGDADFKQRLSVILDKRLTKKRDRAMLGLSEKSTGSGYAENADT